MPVGLMGLSFHIPIYAHNSELLGSDVLSSSSPKSHYYQQAAQHMNQTEMAAREISKDDWRTQAVIYLTRGVFYYSYAVLDVA